ncbi:MAG: YqhV family protein [Limnochordia bacterium]|jgi:type IV secretory pathway VirB2 component (pilin)
MFDEQKLLHGMAGLRVLAGTIEICAALLMLRFGRVDTALRINSLLGAIGPTILLLVSALGLAGLTGKISLDRYLIVVFGVLLIFIGVRR